MKNFLNENQEKPKSIIIDGELHSKIKLFCRGKGLKIGSIIQDLIILYLNNPKLIQKLIDEIKEEKSQLLGDIINNKK